MANYKPNYYGPVPIATTGNTAANGATAGMLGCLVQQSSSQTVSTNTVGPEGTELTEVFKGPTAVLKDIIARKNSTAYGIWKVGQPRPTSNKIISRFTQPTPFDTYSWLISNIEIQQQEAGDHSLMTVKYKQILKDDIDPDGGGVIVHEDSTAWDLTWGSNNVNIFAFCNALSAARPKRIDCVNKDIPGAASHIDKTNPSNYANPENIINYAQSLNINSPVNLKKYQWVQGNYIVELNKHEKEIYEKYAASASPIYHYPIITKTQNIYTTSNHVSSSKITGVVDTIGSPTGCPVYPTNGTFEYLKVAENIYFSEDIDGNNTNLFTITESWWGSSTEGATAGTDAGWDDNFYGTGESRWKIGSR